MKKHHVPATRRTGLCAQVVGEDVVEGVDALDGLLWGSLSAIERQEEVRHKERGVFFAGAR